MKQNNDRSQESDYNTSWYTLRVALSNNVFITKVHSLCHENDSSQRTTRRKVVGLEGNFGKENST